MRTSTAGPEDEDPTLPRRGGRIQARRTRALVSQPYAGRTVTARRAPHGDGTEARGENNRGECQSASLSPPAAGLPYLQAMLLLPLCCSLTFDRLLALVFWLRFLLECSFALQPGQVEIAGTCFLDCRLARSLTCLLACGLLFVLQTPTAPHATVTDSVSSNV